MSAVFITPSSLQRTAAVDERLPFSLLVPLAIQHVLVMYAGAVAVPLIVGRALNLSPGRAEACRP